MGERDHALAVSKHFVYPFSRAIGLERIARGRRSRRALAMAMPSLRRGEWPLPWWLGSRRRLRDALAVFKLVQPPGWVAFALRHRPRVAVFHIVRHPAGFLHFV